MNLENVKKIFLKWNLRKNVWNKIWDCQIHVGLHFCLTATNNFRSLTEAIAISILKYLNGKLLLWYTSNIIIYLLLCVRPFLRNFSHFQILLKIGAIRRLYFN